MVLTNLINSAVKITLFESSGTFTKDRRTMYAIVWGVGGGSGGGTGRKGAAGTFRAGGGGGSNQGVFYYFVPTTCLGSTETVTVGALGFGAGANITDDTNGSNGQNGGQTIFGNLKTYSSAGNSYGGGGTTVDGIGGVQPTIITNFSYTLGSSGGNATGNYGMDLPLQTGGNHGYTQCFCPTGGGGGGSIDAANTIFYGGEGGSIYTCEATPTKILAGGTRGTPNMNNAGRGNYWATITSGGICCGSTSGGGSAGRDTAGSNAGGGGQFSNLGGGSGGGEGATLNSSGASGNGGHGAKGFVQVIEFLA